MSPVAEAGAGPTRRRTGVAAAFNSDRRGRPSRLSGAAIAVACAELSGGSAESLPPVAVPGHCAAADDSEPEKSHEALHQQTDPPPRSCAIMIAHPVGGEGVPVQLCNHDC